MKQNYKSILGLNTVKAFIVVLLSLAIIAIVSLVILGSMNNLNFGSIGNPTYLTANTSTIKAMNATTTYVVSNNANCVLTLTSVFNQSGGTLCTSGNYSISGCTITPLSAGQCNNTIWLLNGYYGDSQEILDLNNNVSTGIIAFFTNSGTYFALLGVVVIILIISLVVVVVNRFGGEGTGMGGTPNQESL